MSDLLKLESLPVETLAEMANEAAAACEASGRKTVEHAATAGRALLAIRPQIPHGEWLDWLKKNFSQSQSRASQYMSIANYYTGTNLESADTIKGALRMIAELPEKQAKKQEREAKKQEQRPEKAGLPPKPLAPATPAPPVTVGTIRNESPPAPQPQPERPAWLADPDEMGLPLADDLPPQPKTNVHYTPENRRQPDARETDRQGLVTIDDPRDYVDGAWYEFDEASGRLFAVTHDQILQRAGQVMAIRSREATKNAESHSGSPIPDPCDTKKVVERERDTKPGKVPTVTQLRSVVEQRADIGTHRHLWSEQMVKGVQEWASYKQSLTGKAKVRSLEQWSVALTRIENVVAAQGWPAVADMIEKAISNGWQGWEHQTDNGRKPAPVAPHRTYTRLSKPEIKYDELPE